METSPTRTPKRKRSSSSIPSHLPPDAINPFSLTPSTLLQFRTAGLSDTDPDPAVSVPDFPHRAFPFKDESQPESRAADEEDRGTGGGGGSRSKEPGLLERQWHVLLQSVHHLLDRGDVERAARAYAILLQLRPSGDQVDVRHHDLWAVGAEILMREGETPPSADGTSERNEGRRRRWGSARHMPKVRAYFETLIQQYPADERRLHKVCSLDFWAALLSCEVYNVYAEHVIGLRAMEDEAGRRDEELEACYGLDEEGYADEVRDRTLAKKERLRQQALADMEKIERTMGEFINESPYRKDVALQRIRAAVALYLGDLVTPLRPVSSLTEENARIRRDAEHDKARTALEQVVRLGGQLDPASIAFLGLEDDEELSMAPMYSSLPIR